MLLAVGTNCSIMSRGLLLTLAISIVVFAGSTQAQSSNSTNGPSLRVGDYTTSGQLTNGSALALWTLVWRAVGSSFATNTIPLNPSFDQDANSAFLAAPHTMVYTVLNIRNAAANNITRKLDGRQGNSDHASKLTLPAVLSRLAELLTLSSCYS